MSNLPIDTPEINSSFVSQSNRRRGKRIHFKTGTSIQLVFNQQQINLPAEGVIIDDSFHGCGLMVKSQENLSSDQSLLILMQELEPIPAQIVWSQKIANNQFRLGVKYVTSKSVKTKIFFQKTH